MEVERHKDRYYAKAKAYQVDSKDWVLLIEGTGDVVSMTDYLRDRIDEGGRTFWIECHLEFPNIDLVISRMNGGVDKFFVISEPINICRDIIIPKGTDFNTM